MKLSFLDGSKFLLRRRRKQPRADDMNVFVANHRVEPFTLGYPYKPLLVGAFREESDVKEESSDRPCCDLEGWYMDCWGDEEGISQRNIAYCELTGLWWIWKSFSSESVVGLMHYRRLLGECDSNGELRPLDAAAIANALEGYDCLVAQREYFKYPVAHDYNMCHQLEDLVAVRDALKKESPRYMRAFYKVMDSNALHPYNMLVARRELFDGYCAWLFGVLARVEKVIDPFFGRDPMQVRVFGFLAERLLNVWLEANRVSVREFPIWSPSDAVIAEASSRYADICQSKGYPPVDTKTSDLLSPIRDLGFKFDHGFYVRTYDDVWETFGDNRDATCAHAYDYGVDEQRVTSPFGDIREFANIKPLIRSQFDGDAQKLDALLRDEFDKEVSSGSSDGSAMYLSRNKMFGETVLNGIDYSSVYDYAYYVGRYDDVPRDDFDSLCALRHFVNVGMEEGRVGSAHFDVNRFKEANPQLVEALGSDPRSYYMYYIEHQDAVVPGSRYQYCV